MNLDATLCSQHALLSPPLTSVNLKQQFQGKEFLQRTYSWYFNSAGQKNLHLKTHFSTIFCKIAKDNRINFKYFIFIFKVKMANDAPIRIRCIWKRWDWGGWGHPVIPGCNTTAAHHSPSCVTITKTLTIIILLGFSTVTFMVVSIKQRWIPWNKFLVNENILQKWRWSSLVWNKV